MRVLCVKNKTVETNCILELNKIFFILQKSREMDDLVIMEFFICTSSLPEATGGATGEATGEATGGATAGATGNPVLFTRRGRSEL